MVYIFHNFTSDYWLVNYKGKDGTVLSWLLFIRPSNYGMDRASVHNCVHNCLWTKTSDAIDLGHSAKTKLAAAAVWRLTLYPMQDIACEHDILKTGCLIDFTFRYGRITTKTSDAVDLGHSTKTKMAATAFWRLTLYPMSGIACERDSLKTACPIDFTFWYGLYTTKTSDAIDLGHSTKTKMAATAVWRSTL